jgi:Terminase small subunit
MLDTDKNIAELLTWPEAVSGLPLKEKRFAVCYSLNGFNASDAARRAGYKCSSPRSYATVGHRAINRPRIRAAIEKLLADNNAESEAMLALLAKLKALSAPRDFIATQLGGEHALARFEKILAERNVA